MKSLLSSVLLQSLAQDKELIAKGQIVCINEKDYKALSEFLGE